MCKGKCGSNCQGCSGKKTIAQLIEDNKQAIADVFTKYDGGNLPVNLYSIAKLAAVKGEAFINDLAQAWMPNFTGFDGYDDANLIAPNLKPQADFFRDLYSKGLLSDDKFKAGMDKLFKAGATAQTQTAAIVGNILNTTSQVAAAGGNVAGMLGGTGASLGPNGQLTTGASNTTNTAAPGPGNTCQEGYKLNPDTGVCEKEEGFMGFSTTQIVLGAAALILVLALVFGPSKGTAAGPALT